MHDRHQMSTERVMQIATADTYPPLLRSLSPPHSPISVSPRVWAVRDRDVVPVCRIC